MAYKQFLSKILFNDKFLFRSIRYIISLIILIGIMYHNFSFIAISIFDASPQITLQYTPILIALIGILTTSIFWIISHLIRRYLLENLKINYFIFSLAGIHFLSSELILAYLKLLYLFFPLSQLPKVYSTNFYHINFLTCFQVPFDSIILYQFVFPLLYNNLVYALSLKLIKDLFLNQIKKVELEKENFRLEFAFLKAQLNPHFLFNTLNNIYSFSIRTPEKVSDSILKLSDMMRYTLYETNDERVLLSKEVAFLTSFVDLQRIRHDKHVLIRFTITGQPTAQLIPPLLFIVFIENAFKHGVQSTIEPSWIDINLSIQPFSITLSVNNSIPTLGMNTSGGIGLRNVQKRLAYYYPEDYTLAINQTDEQFSINLYLNLHERGLQSNRNR